MREFTAHEELEAGGSRLVKGQTHKGMSCRAVGDKRTGERRKRKKKRRRNIEFLIVEGTGISRYYVSLKPK